VFNEPRRSGSGELRDRHVVAIGGGDFDRARPLHDYIHALAGVPRPRICTLATASGDSDSHIAAGYEAFTSDRWQASHLRLFDRTVADIRSLLLAQHVIFVGGGSTANMLAVWRVHGVDSILREAWTQGVVLSGISAGANCWFECAVTDSFGGIDPLNEGIALLAGSACPHYSGDPERRPTYHRLIAAGFPAGYAIDDDVALHFVGTELEEVVACRDAAYAYRVRKDHEEVVEQVLFVRRL
jgi:dipeptidase E